MCSLAREGAGSPTAISQRQKKSIPDTQSVILPRSLYRFRPENLDLECAEYGRSRWSRSERHCASPACRLVSEAIQEMGWALRVRIVGT